jgi:hypothetical protein
VALLTPALGVMSGVPSTLMHTSVQHQCNPYKGT